MKDTWQEDELTPHDIEKFLKIHGKRGVKTLSLLGRNHNVYEFASSEIGTTLLKNTMSQMEQLLNKIIDGKATPEETIEYRVRSEFFVQLTDKIDKYLGVRKKVKEC